MPVLAVAKRENAKKSGKRIASPPSAFDKIYRSSPLPRRVRIKAHDLGMHLSGTVRSLCNVAKKESDACPKRSPGVKQGEAGTGRYLSRSLQVPGDVGSAQPDSLHELVRPCL